ncbi:hypothetical protein GCM10007989_22610 [Devosia pacifica]|uniref:Uncharacterized protein n=1 Tax=Devosia pacifica TaxID=1335967 RepID=A0A918S8I3_9HYPH|nr:hypothetical protein [Devosia pacifica]GHA26312.1 hypothetical protein GCM10007989_22610 [Devosia pacifica]
MTIPGILAIVLAIVSAAGVSAFLSWRLPMAPLSSAVIAAGTVAGLVLGIAGMSLFAFIVVVAGLAAAGAGVLYDRAVLKGWQLVLADAAITAIAIVAAVRMAPTALDLAAPLLLETLIGALAIGVCGLGLRRADRLPGYSASIAACVAAVATFLALWLDAENYLAIWWLAAFGAALAGLAIITRARAAQFGAAGTSFIAVEAGLLILALLEHLG